MCFLHVSKFYTIIKNTFKVFFRLSCEYILLGEGRRLAQETLAIGRLNLTLDPLLK
jgi:hypothetical protein